MLLSRQDGASGGLLRVNFGAPLVLAVAGVHEFAVLLDGLGFALDRASTAGAADVLACRELVALLREAGDLLVLAGALGPLALGLLLGQVLLDRGRRDPRGELPERSR